MCLPGQPPGPSSVAPSCRRRPLAPPSAAPSAGPACAADAVAMARAGLAALARVDAAGLTAAEQADCLRALEQAESMHIAARARVLAAFHAGDGCRDDGHGSAKMWLRWQTRITKAAAAGAMAWMRRLAAHPAVADALAAGELSGSWARAVCGWSDLLPAECRAGADAILLAAAAGGAELADLAALAEEIRRRTARPDRDGDDGFTGRGLCLDVTFGQSGKLAGDLTPQCTAALGAVLDALGKRAGPEDLRSPRQRRHDALEEACRRLIASGCVPDRAGQPTQIQVHMTLDQLRGLAGPEGEAAWAGWPPAAPGADCDASVVPVVTGHLDHQLLNQLTAEVAAELLRTRPGTRLPGTPRPGTPRPGTPRPGTPLPGPGPRPGAGQPGAGQPGTSPDAAAAARRLRAERAVRRLITARAADLMSGPGGLAAYLRTRLPDDLIASASLPLDIGAVTDTIPVHLRRAVTVRDRHCRFPGCTQPATACQPHHIIPRAQGGPTSLANLINLCTFHHLIAIHRWGWAITLHPDGTTTATSPYGQTLHSHSPPPQGGSPHTTAA